MIVPGLGDLPVFPCNTRKQPLVKGGYKAARRIEPPKHWPLVGVPTGMVSGFDCVDVDPEGLEWLAANPIVGTRAHRTRRGGWHFLLRALNGLTGSADTRIERGIHVRASGNYIIWWPRAGFEVLAAPIADWPEDLLRLARSKSRVGCIEKTPRLGGCNPCGVGMRVSPRSREGRYAQAALRNAFDDLANKSARGSRNDTLNKLAFKLGGLLANEWIDGGVVVRVLLLAATSCGLVREDGQDQCLATILSGLRAGMDRPYPPLGPWETLKPKHAANMGVFYTKAEIETEAEIENRSKGE